MDQKIQNNTITSSDGIIGNHVDVSFCLYWGITQSKVSAVWGAKSTRTTSGEEWKTPPKTTTTVHWNALQPLARNLKDKRIKWSVERIGNSRVNPRFFQQYSRTSFNLYSVQVTKEVIMCVHLSTLPPFWCLTTPLICRFWYFHCALPLTT